MDEKKKESHWSKLDHIAFLLMLPFIIITLFSINWDWKYIGYTSVFITFALLYDIYEDKEGA